MTKLSEDRPCYRCGKNPAFKTGSYCGKCQAKINMVNTKKREERKIIVALNLAKIDSLVGTITRNLGELEETASNGVRLFLLGQSKRMY